MMQKEILDWRSQYRQLTEELEKEERYFLRRLLIKTRNKQFYQYFTV